MIIEQNNTTDTSRIVLSHTSYSMGPELNEMLLIPDNKGELLIPFSKGIKLKLIGSTKQINLEADNCFFLKPRRRGMEVSCEQPASFLVVKINPIYVREYSKNLDEVSTGVHAVDLSRVALTQLRNAHKLNSLQVEEIIKKGANLSLDFEFVNGTVAESIERIRDTSGTIKVSEIYSSLNVSKSKLEQHFNNEIGLTPKEFCKIEKINFFINSYQQNVGKNLTELTYQCGYYDQSHLIKDFRYFLDKSPKKFFNEQSVMVSKLAS